MIDKVILIKEFSEEMHFIKNLVHSKFIKSRVKKIELYFENIILRSLNKVAAPIKKKFTLLHWILINVIVFAYFAGKAEVQNISQFELIFQEYSIVGFYAICLNIGALVLLKFIEVLTFISKVIVYALSLIIGVYLAFFIMKRLWDFFTLLRPHKTLAKTIGE